MKDDLRLALRALTDPTGDPDPRVDRLAAIMVGALVLVGAIGTYLAISPWTPGTVPADARAPGVVITPSATSRQ